ncbi:MAG: tetratricopeptide repeat-containing sensor histidine kinase [Bacteroidales bacterium]|nr:tetratricopeptide repeat-containing sensor histidine kinase [Bacteroidales bacterium]
MRLVIFFFIATNFFPLPKAYCDDVSINYKRDSLFYTVTAMPNDTLKVLELSRLSLGYLNEQLDTAYILGKKALDLSEKLSYEYGIAKSLDQLGVVFRYQANYEMAIEYSELSFKLYDKMGKLGEKAEILNSLGNVYKRIGNYEKAMESLLTSHRIYSEINDSTGLARLIGDLAILYSQMGEYDKSLQYNFQALEIRRRPNIEDKLICTNLMNIGIVYGCKEEHNKALQYYQEAINLVDDNTNKVLQAKLLHNMAATYHRLRKYNLAKNYYLKSLEMKEGIGGEDSKASSWNGLGTALIMLGDYEKGEEYLLKAYNFSKEKGKYKNATSAAKSLVWFYKYREDYKRALFYQQMYQQVSDSLIGIEKIRRLTEVEQKYEVEKKEQQIAFLEKEKQVQILDLQKKTTEARQKNLQRNFLVMVVLLIVVVLVFVSSDNKKRKQRNKLLLKQNRTIFDQRTEIVRQNDELLESNRTKDKLFQIIAHDLRSPLVSIDSLTQLIPYWIEEQDYESLGKMAKTMELSVDNILALIDDLLGWALNQQGKFPFNPESFEINEALENAIKVYAPVADVKHIRVSVHSAIEIRVFADRNMFLTIIRNILNNAIKFTPEKGKIEIGAEHEGDFARIWVKDSGIGIPADKREKIFELANGGAEGTKGEVGKGLGLFFCKEFVNLNNGDVSIESEPEQGTTISFTLPLNSNTTL